MKMKELIHELREDWRFTTGAALSGNGWVFGDIDSSSRRMDEGFHQGMAIVALASTYFWRLVGCKHKTWQDESWGCPDSGGVGGYCPRCGYSFSETLY